MRFYAILSCVSFFFFAIDKLLVYWNRVFPRLCPVLRFQGLCLRFHRPERVETRKSSLDLFGQAGTLMASAVGAGRTGINYFLSVIIWSRLDPNGLFSTQFYAQRGQEIRLYIYIWWVCLPKAPRSRDFERRALGNLDKMHVAPFNNIHGSLWYCFYRRAGGG